MSIDHSQSSGIPATIAAINGISELQATRDTVLEVNGANHVKDLSTHAGKSSFDAEECVHDVIKLSGKVTTSAGPGNIFNDVAAMTKSVRDLSEPAVASAPETDATALNARRADEADGAAARDSAIKGAKISSKAPKVANKTKTTTKKATVSNDEDLAADILGALSLGDINDTTGVGSQQDNIHIRVQQRNGRKVLTIVENIPKKYDERKLLKELKRILQCGGSLVGDKEKVIQLNGDHRNSVSSWILEYLDVEKDSIVIHGF